MGSLMPRSNASGDLWLTVESAAQRHPKRPALWHPRRAVTYGDLSRRLDGRSYGDEVLPGDIPVFQCDDFSANHVASMLAAVFRDGRTVALLSPRIDMRDCGAIPLVSRHAAGVIPASAAVSLWPG